MRRVLDIMKGREFQSAVAALPGYKAADTGVVHSVEAFLDPSTARRRISDFDPAKPSHGAMERSSIEALAARLTAYGVLRDLQRRCLDGFAGGLGRKLHRLLGEGIDAGAGFRRGLVHH